MNIDCIKKIIQNEVGILHHFEFHGSRNQIEEFTGTIIKTFSSIFIIRLTDGSIRSYSYGDYIIKFLRIIS